MKLTENKLYLSQDLESTVTIADGVQAMIYDTDGVIEKVHFGQDASLEYFGYFENGQVVDALFALDGVWSRAQVHVLQKAKSWEIRSKIEWRLLANNATANIQIVSFVSDEGMIDLDGIINITSGIEKVEGYLTEENIFLGSSGKVRGIPTLLVHSDDVKASHACNMERISDEKLFYLRSRWLPKDDATVLMLSGYIGKIFGGLRENHGELYEQIEKDILENI